jgi:hypothetical protein
MSEMISGSTSWVEIKSPKNKFNPTHVKLDGLGSRAGIIAQNPLTNISCCSTPSNQPIHPSIRSKNPSFSPPLLPSFLFGCLQIFVGSCDGLTKL